MDETLYRLGRLAAEADLIGAVGLRRYPALLREIETVEEHTERTLGVGSTDDTMALVEEERCRREQKGGE